MQDQPISAVPALIAELRTALTRLPVADTEALLQSAATVQRCLAQVQKDIAAGKELPVGQSDEITELLEQYSDLLNRSQARTDRALLALGIGQGVYRNPSKPQAAGGAISPQISRAHLTA